MNLERRKSGISLIADLPWGSHFCLFYRTAEDLIEVLLPYFSAGLEHNELCVLVTPEKAGDEDVQNALKKAASGFMEYARKGQMEIIPYGRWRAMAGASDSAVVSMLERASAVGFDGLRVAFGALPEMEDGKPSPVHGRETVNGHNALALFAYPRAGFDALRLMEVIKNHHFALLRNEGKWEVIESSEARVAKADEEILKLNEELKRKITELSDANVLLRDSRRAALNMMEDAETARRQAEEAYQKLQREVAERRRAEEALREGEEKYRRIVETANEGIWVVDADRRTTYVNTRMAELLGYSVEEMPGKSGLEFLDPEGRTLSDANIEKRKKGMSDSYEYKLIRKDKSILWAIVNAVPLFEKDGTFLGTLSMITDITERKRAEEALKESERRLHSLFENMSEGFAYCKMLYDESGRPVDFVYLDVNSSFRKITGLDHVVGQKVTEAIPGIRESHPELFDTYGRVASTGKPERFEIEFKPLGMWLSVSAYSIGTGYFVAVFDDVTERKRAEEEIRRRNAVLAGINAIFTEALSSDSDEKLAQACLRVAEELTGSKFGFIGEIGPDGMLHDTAISDPGWELCAMRNTTGHRMPPGNFKLHGIYGSVVADGKAFYTNDPGSHPDSIGTPEGHPPLNAFLGVPFVQDGRTIGMIAVGNRNGGYRDGELDSLKALAPSVIEALQRTRSEGALKHSLRRFELLALTASELLQAADPQKAVESICRKVMEFLDCHAFFNFLVEESSGKLRLNACAGIPPEDAKRIEWLDFGVAVCSCVARDGERIVAEHIPTAPDMRTALVKSYGVKAYCCHPLLGPGGKVIGTLSFGTRSRETFSDNDLSLMKAVTDQVATAMTRKTAEDEILKLSENMAARNLELESLNKELEAFNYSISHDLRAPIRSMAGFSKIVAEDYAEKLDDQGRDYLARIQNASDKMTHLIDDLLNLSRISRQPTDRMDIDLSGLSDSVVLSLREAYAGRNVEIVVREGLRASVDPNLMRVVLTNLLDNAWKFTGKTEKARVEFGALEKEGETVYFVKDNGAGFNQEYAYKMFWPFHRLHTDKEFAGTGIGLAIVDRIIRRHGGRIWAEGEVGKGATIYFTLG